MDVISILKATLNHIVYRASASIREEHNQSYPTALGMQRYYANMRKEREYFGLFTTSLLLLNVKLYKMYYFASEFQNSQTNKA